jgi:hypothetical protein
MTKVEDTVSWRDETAKGRAGVEDAEAVEVSNY